MGASGFTRVTLSQMRLSQLRELARRIGVARYSSMIREQLIAGILVKAPLTAAPLTGAPESAPPAAAFRLNSAPEASESAPLAGVQAPAPLSASLLSTSEVGAMSLPLAAPPAEQLSEPLAEIVGSPLPSPEAGSASPSPASEVVLSSSLPVGEPVEQKGLTPPAPAADESLPSLVELGSPSWVALLTRDPQWATVCWAISSQDREQALAAGGQELALRLTDVTDTPEIGGRPHTLQEVWVDTASHEWHLPVPLGNRDYRVELGYRLPSGGWYSLARSSATRISAEMECTTDQFPPFHLVQGEDGPTWLTPLPAPGLHERIYQQASVLRSRISQGSEGFHQHNQHLEGAAGDQASGVGVWASGREASGAGMAARQRSFWLVADAELIVYGATDPAATLTVGDAVTPLAQDGTFQFHMAFPDGEQTYPIRALAADGEQKRSITMDFRRSTPHARVNPKDSAVPEWF